MKCKICDGTGRWSHPLVERSDDLCHACDGRGVRKAYIERRNGDD